MQGRLKEAIDNYLKVLTIDPTDIQVKYNLGEIFYMLDYLFTDQETLYTFGVVSRDEKFSD
ncbi:tetratricopeptide repeat protein [Candidatus Cloacimonadota bacterium]